MSTRVNAADYSKDIGQNKNSDQRLMNFEWSCKPILCSMRLLGIDLKLSESQTNDCKMKCRSSIFTTCVGLFSFLVNLTFSSFFCYYRLFIYADDPRIQALRKNSTSTLFWNSTIDSLNTSFITLGVHFFLLASTIVNWNDLADVLRKMEKQNFFKLKVYREFRRVCDWGLCFILVVCTVYIGEP